MYHLDYTGRLLNLRNNLLPAHVRGVLGGFLVGASADGLRLSLGFFEDVVVPSYLLQATSKWDARRRTWIWEYSDDSDDFVYTQHAQASAAEATVTRQAS